MGPLLAQHYCSKTLMPIKLLLVSMKHPRIGFANAQGWIFFVLGHLIRFLTWTQRRLTCLSRLSIFAIYAALCIAKTDSFGKELVR
jgi:hypothetical protein